MRGSNVAAAAAALAVGLAWSLTAAAAPVLARPAAGDLAVTIETVTSFVQAGGVVAYNVVVTNEGQTALAPVAVTLGLDAKSLRPLSASSSSVDVACSESGGPSCLLTTLPAGDHTYLRFMARVVATPSRTATTTVTAAGGGQSATSSTQTTIDTSVRPADLALSLVSSHGGPRGAAWTWRIGNRGPGAAPATLFEEWGALGTNSITRVHASHGTCTITGEAYSTATIHCSLGTIRAKAAVTITIFAPSYHETGISLIEHPSVASRVPDPNPDDDGGGNPRKVLLKAR